MLDKLFNKYINLQSWDESNQTRTWTVMCRGMYTAFVIGKSEL